MPLFLTDEQKVLKENLRRFTESHIVPVRAELDEKEEFPWAIVKEMADAGIFGVYIDEAYGGMVCSSVRP